MPLRHSIGEQGGGDQNRNDAQNAVGLFMWVRMEVGFLLRGMVPYLKNVLPVPLWRRYMHRRAVGACRDTRQGE